MDKNRKTSHILNVFQYDADGHVVLPASLTLSIAPGASDNNSKVPTTAWVRTYVSGLSYQGAITLTTSGTSGAATLVGNTLNIPTYTLAGLGGQPALNGTGFVKISGTTISYDNNTYATETYVGTQIANLVDSSPATLDTLNELAAALGDDPNFATTVATSIGTKQAQLNGTGFVKVTGTTVSYDNSTYLTTSSAASTYQIILTNPVTGTGTSGYIPKFTGASTIGSSLIYDTNSVVLIGATTSSGDTQTKLELINNGPVGLKIKSSAVNGNNTFLSIESSKEWRFVTNRGDLISGNQGDLIIRNNTDAVNAIILNQSGAVTFSSSITTSGNINVNSDGIFINRTTSGEPYIFFKKDGVNRASIYGVTGGGLRIFDESDNQVLTITGTRLGISDPSPSRKLTVNFGTSVNDGLIVYGSQRQNTVFRSTGEHCFLFIDSHHADTFLPVLTFQRSSVSYGSIGLNRASNSDGIGAYAESEMVVGSVTTVPFSLQTNGVRRIRINGSGGQVEIFNTLSVSGNLSARNFIKNIKTWYPAGSTGSGTSVTYNWADELAALAGNFDSAGFYKGFLRSSNGAHYHGYHFDILVGSQGYGSNSLQYKVQNIVLANAPWAGGCGFSPFGTVDTTNFVHNNNPCGEALELFITRLG